MLTLLIICGALLGIYIVLCLTVMKMPKCKSSAKLHGKTVIVTGANAGIGKATALELAKRGARVILACRDKQRAETALNDIKKASGSSQVVYMHLDLASLQSIHSFVKNFLKTEPRLDILINNAGLLKSGKTKEDFGMIFGVNHIGAFLLTVLLLERLKECGPSRIVTVASNCYKLGNIDLACISTYKDLSLGKSFVDLFMAYSDSKLCNLLFTHELAKRLEGTNVTCYSVHPGSIKTDIARHSQLWIRIILKPILALFFLTAESGAQTSLHCALEEGIEHLNGCYFSGCEVKDVNPKARDDATAKKLWEVSERLCGLA